MVAILKAAMSIATGTLAFSSVRNMAETIYITTTTATTHSNNAPDRPSSSNGDNPLSQYLGYDSNNSDKATTVLMPSDKSTEEIIQDLQRMRRKDLLTLFLHCDAPEDHGVMLQGSWDGILLNNNSVLVSQVSTTLSKLKIKIQYCMHRIIFVYLIYMVFR